MRSEVEDRVPVLANSTIADEIRADPTGSPASPIVNVACPSSSESSPATSTIAESVALPSGEPCGTTSRTLPHSNSVPVRSARIRLPGGSDPDRRLVNHRRPIAGMEKSQRISVARKAVANPDVNIDIGAGRDDIVGIVNVQHHASPRLRLRRLRREQPEPTQPH